MWMLFVALPPRLDVLRISETNTYTVTGLLKSEGLLKDILGWEIIWKEVWTRDIEDLDNPVNTQNGNASDDLKLIQI